MSVYNGQQLLGAAELSKLLGVSRQRVSQLTVKPWFPPPVTRLAMGAVWDMVDIERLRSGTGRALDHTALEAHLIEIEERHRAGLDGRADGFNGGAGAGDGEQV